MAILTARTEALASEDQITDRGTGERDAIGLDLSEAGQPLNPEPIDGVEGRQTSAVSVQGADDGAVHAPGDGQSAGVTLTVSAGTNAWLGAPVTANPADARVQQHASVAELESGGHVVTWVSGFGYETTPTVHAQRFDAAGAKVGGVINVGTAPDNPGTATLGLANGGFLVVWQDAAGLKAQFYTAAGAAAGSAILLESPEFLSLSAPPTAIQTPDGDIIVAYGGFRVDGPSGQGVAARRLSADRQLEGERFILSEATDGHQGQPHITAAPDGGFMALWLESDGFHARRFDAAGDGGPASLVRGYGSAQERDPVIAVLNDGSAVVVWHSARATGSNRDIWAQRLDADGAPQGEAFLVGIGGQAPTTNILALADGGFAVAYTRTNTTTVRRFDADGGVVGGDAHTGGNLTGIDALALNGTGELVVLTTVGTWPPDVGIRRLELPNAFETTEDIAVALTMSMTQVDPAEHGQVLIEGLPEGSVLSAGVLQADGFWLLEAADLAGLSLTPPADYAGLIQVTATAFTDGDIANGARRSFAVEVAPVNDAPRTTADFVHTLEDHWVTFDPLANDREVEGEAMTITHLNGQAVTAGQSVVIAGVGSLKLNADGTVTFTPVANWSGDQAFTYVVRDASGVTTQGSGLLRLDGVTDGGSFVYGQLANWTPTALDATDVVVNTTTAGVQSQSSVTALADGGYLIAWVSAGQDGSGTGIFAQRYDRHGQKVGGEQQVNALTAGDQQHTAVLAMEDGGWVIAWSGPIEGGSTTGIYARRYDADGQAVQTHLVTDATFNQFYSGVAYNQGAPTLTAWGDDGFAIGWTTFYSATDNDTWIRQYGADGTVLGDHWIEADGELEDHPQMVTGADGVVLVIYQDSRGFYNGPTSGMDQDYGIWIERHGLNGGLSNPIQLNTTIVGNQTHPALTILANGNIVAAWQTADASGTGIVFRLLDPEGAPILAERFANRTTAGNQTSPDIVALADGSFIILWTSAGTDGSGAGVYGQRVSADGSLYLGAEFRLNATTAGDQLSDSAVTDTSFAVLEDGTLVATWWGGGEVYQRRFDPPEAAFTAYQGEEIAIPLTVTLVDASETFELAISNLPPGAVLSAGTQRADGARVVTAAEAATLTLTPPPGYAGEMLLRIEITTVDGANRSTLVSYREVQVLPVDNEADGAEVGFRTGADPVADEDVNVTGVQGGDYRDGGVAALTGGGHGVVWSALYGDSDGQGVRAKVYGADGSVVSVNEFWGDPGDFTVNTFKTGAQLGPSVLSLADGGFAVFWHSFNQDGSGVGVYGQRFDATGLKVGVEFRVNSTTALTQEAPTATLLDDGGFVVLFESEPVTGQGFEVRGQRFDADGAPVDGEFVVRDMTGGSQRLPDVTALETGGFVATWVSFDTDGSGTSLEMRIYDDRNDPTVYQLNQVTAGSQDQVKVTTLADGSFLAVWTTMTDQPGADQGIHARRFEVGADGVTAWDEFMVVRPSGGSVAFPDVVGLPDGGWIVVWNWETPDDSGVDLYGRRYDAEGRQVGDLFRINKESFGDQTSIDVYADPMVTLDANGDLLVVWTDMRDGNLYRQTFDIDPEPPFVGDARQPIDLAIEVEARDASESVEIVLSNLPAGAVLSAGTRQADGSWLLGQGDLDGLTLVTQAESAGTAFDLIITVTTRQGADSFTTVAYQRIDVLPAPPGVTLTGTEAADVLSGDGGGDTLTGMAGDDVLDGLGGEDMLVGGLGDDVLSGGLDDDTLDGGLGDDRIDGGAGHDILTVSGVFSDYRLLMSGDDFILKGPEGGDYLTGVESVQFADGRVLELNRMYGPGVEGGAWAADGRIPEALLSGGPSGGDQPLVLPGVEESGSSGRKDHEGPQVLPGAFDPASGAKGHGEPQILPGVDEARPYVGLQARVAHADDWIMAPDGSDEGPTAGGDGDEQVLPGLDDQFDVGKCADQPLVLPGSGDADPFSDLETGSSPGGDGILSLDGLGGLLGPGGRHEDWM